MVTAWNGEGGKHRPVYDAENGDEQARRQAQLDAIDHLAAFDLSDVHGYRQLFRGIAWTVVLALILIALGIGYVAAWRATR